MVVGNELPRPVTFTLSLPLATMGLTTDQIVVTDALDGGTATRGAGELDHLRVDVGADYSPGGGVRVFHLAPSPQA